MGQYYHPIILEDDKKTIKAYAYSHDYGNGLKLMEHSYLGNRFMLRIERELEGNPQRLVWAGDYADTEGSDKNLHCMADDSGKKLPPMDVSDNECRYIVNHDRREFIDKESIEGVEWGGDIWKVHPLSLLTAEGNGRGGGDYNGSGSGSCGKWARDRISLEVEPPKDFEEVVFDFKEQ
jgi:hypothetical protein